MADQPLQPGIPSGAPTVETIPQGEGSGRPKPPDLDLGSALAKSQPLAWPTTGAAVPSAAPSQASSPPKPLFGGNVGKKLRRDGLVAGSPEAKEADRAKDRERKRIANALKRAAMQPPPLPSVPPEGKNPSDLDPIPTPAASGSADIVSPGLEAGLPTVPWQPDTLRPLLEQLVEAAEESRVAHFLARCADAGLTGKLVREIEADARFPKAAKVLLCRALPRLSAKYLNKIGLSSEYEDELACIGAVLLIVQNDRKLESRLVELIEAAKAKTTPAEPSQAHA